MGKAEIRECKVDKMENNRIEVLKDKLQNVKHGDFATKWKLQDEIKALEEKEPLVGLESLDGMKNGQS